MIGINIEMPKSCSDCLMCKELKEDMFYCRVTDEILRGEAFYRKRFDDCPLKETKIDTQANISKEHEKSELILCKNCKYFEYDSVTKVDEIPLIVAHEICKKWGEGCKTNENGYCFLAELKGE